MSDTVAPTKNIAWQYRLKSQFSAVTIGLILVVVAIFGSASYWQTLKILNEEIEKSGVRITQEVELLAQQFFGELCGRAGTLLPGEVKDKYETELRKRFTGTEASKDIVDVAIKGSEDFHLLGREYTTITAAGLGSYRISSDIKPTYHATLDPEIAISRATVSVIETNTTIRVRLFEKDVYDQNHNKVGTVFVALSAQKINETRNKLLTGMGIALAIAVAIGISTSYALARKVTNPISDLVRDFAIVSRGNLEHRTRSRDKSEIGFLARSFDEMTIRLRAAQKAEIAYKAREHELKVATAIQLSLLPTETPHLPGFDIHAYYRPSREVGGDYYDFINVDEDRLGIVVADVSGKGIPASLVMALARSIMRMAARDHRSTAQVLKQVNTVIAPDLRRGTFVTVLYMILNYKDKEICFSSAGHNPFVLREGSSGQCQFLRTNGIAVGFDKGPIFNSTIGERTISLQRGDRVLIYTDGVIESRNGEGTQFGEHRLSELISSAGQVDSATLVNTIVDEVSRHEGPEEQHDDITIATFGVL